MAVIRRYTPQVAERIPNPTPARATQTSIGALGQGVDALGEMSMDWQDEIDTAVAKEADAKYADFVREQLYGENGFMYLDGSNAITQRRAVSELMQAQFDGSFEGMTVGARNKAERALDARRMRALESIDRHSTGQHKAYLNTASEARINSAINDAVADPTLSAVALKIVNEEMSDYVARNGLPPEAGDVRLQKYVSDMHTAIVDKLLTEDPLEAGKYLDQHRGEIIGSQGLQRTVDTAVLKATGQAAGAAAYQQSKMNAGAVAALSTLEEATGLKLNVISAHRTPEHNREVGGAEGSLHLSGQAFDIDVSHMSIPERQALIRQARAAGFGGIGVYANSLHFDVGAERSWGWSHKNGSLPDWAREAVATPVGEMDTAVGDPMADILQLDPRAQAYALDHFKDLQSFETGQTKVRRDAAIEEAYRLIEMDGATLDQLPDDFKTAIGFEGMSSLRSYERKLAEGTPRVTDWEVYTELMRQAANEPETFAAANPAEWRDSLSDTHYAALVKKQADIIEGRSAEDIDISISKIRTSLSSMAALDSMTKADRDQLEGRMMAWEQAFVAANNRLPTDPERDDAARTYMTTVYLNTPGFGTEEEPLFAFDFMQDPNDRTDDITIERLENEGLALEINDTWVYPSKEQIQAVEAILTEQNGGTAPTAQDVVAYLIGLARMGELAPRVEEGGGNGG